MKIIYIFILCITVIENYYSQLIVSSFPYECIFNQSAAFYNTILKDFPLINIYLLMKEGK